MKPKGKSPGKKLSLGGKRLGKAQLKKKGKSPKKKGSLKKKGKKKISPVRSKVSLVSQAGESVSLEASLRKESNPFNQAEDYEDGSYEEDYDEQGDEEYADYGEEEEADISEVLEATNSAVPETRQTAFQQLLAVVEEESFTDEDDLNLLLGIILQHVADSAPKVQSLALTLFKKLMEETPEFFATQSAECIPALLSVGKRGEAQASELLTFYKQLGHSQEILTAFCETSDLQPSDKLAQLLKQSVEESSDYLNSLPNAQKLMQATVSVFGNKSQFNTQCSNIVKACSEKAPDITTSALIQLNPPAKAAAQRWLEQPEPRTPSPPKGSPSRHSAPQHRTTAPQTLNNRGRQSTVKPHNLPVFTVSEHKFTSEEKANSTLGAIIAKCRSTSAAKLDGLQRIKQLSLEQNALMIESIEDVVIACLLNLCDEVAEVREMAIYVSKEIFQHQASLLEPLLDTCLSKLAKVFYIEDRSTQRGTEEAAELLLESQDCGLVAAQLVQLVQTENAPALQPLLRLLCKTLRRVNPVQRAGQTSNWFAVLGTMCGHAELEVRRLATVCLAGAKLQMGDHGAFADLLPDHKKLVELYCERILEEEAEDNY